MTFQAEHIIFSHTLVATAVLVAGDPVDGAGAKASGPDDFTGVAISNAAIGDHLPLVTLGSVAVKADSGSAGIVAGDRITYATDGYDATTGPGFGIAIDAAAASGDFRMVILPAAAAKGAALTAIDATAIDAVYDAVEQAVLDNVRTRLNELEARLKAAGLIA